MTKLKTAVQKEVFEPVRTEQQVTGTVEVTQHLNTFVQEQINYLSQRAVNHIGQIANYANVAAFQTTASFNQMFGDDRGLASDSNQRELKYAAQTIAGNPDMLVQLKPTGNVYGTQDADGVQSTVFSDTDRNKIQLSEFGYKVVTENAEKYAKVMSDITMLNQQFGLEPTTSREERYAEYKVVELTNKRRKQEMQARTESKFAENKQHNECILQLVQVANATAHLV